MRLQSERAVAEQWLQPPARRPSIARSAAAPPPHIARTVSRRCPLKVPPPAAVVCRGLRKVYPGGGWRGGGGGDVVAVDGIDLAVARGECFGLLGPNGAGKTTTVEILEGLTAPTAGEVSLCGLSWRTDEAELRQRIGVALQETRLSDKLIRQRDPGPVPQLLSARRDRWSRCWTWCSCTRSATPG